MNRFEYLNRFSQPSTWAGIGILLGLFGVEMAPAEAQTFVQGGVGFAGLLAVFLNEAKPK